MKKIVAISLLATSIGVFAQEESISKHGVAPKVFYRTYSEKEYDYSVYGGGWEYSYSHPEGMNFKLSAFSNGRNKNSFREGDSSFFFKFPTFENQWVYPIISFKYFMKDLGKSFRKEIYVNKCTSYVGIGWEIVPCQNFNFNLEGCVSHDSCNVITWKRDDHSSSQQSSLPYGFKGKAGMSFKCKEHLFLDAEGYYAQTFKKNYKTAGCEISFRVAF